MALGKLGAFFNKDMGALVKDAGKVLNPDLGTIAKGAGRLLKADLGELLHATPAKKTPPAETVPAGPAAPQTPAQQPSPRIATMAAPFDPDTTQKMERVSANVLNAAPIAPGLSPTAPFDPDVTQKMVLCEIAGVSPAPVNLRVETGPPAAAFDPSTFNQQLLRRTQRTAPTGSDARELLPYLVGELERPRSTPSGEITNDPVNAVYSGPGESVLVQLALTWDEDEALQLVDETRANLGRNTCAAPDRTCVIGMSSQGVVYAWARDCYFFCATSPKGPLALEHFLSAYPY